MTVLGRVHQEVGAVSCERYSWVAPLLSSVGAALLHPGCRASASKVGESSGCGRGDDPQAKPVHMLVRVAQVQSSAGRTASATVCI